MYSFQYFAGVGLDFHGEEMSAGTQRKELDTGLEARNGLHQDKASDAVFTPEVPHSSVIEFGTPEQRTEFAANRTRARTEDQLDAYRKDKKQLDAPIQATDAVRGFSSSDRDGLEEQQWEASQSQATTQSLQQMMRGFNDDREDSHLDQQRLFDSMASFNENVARDISHAYRRINWLAIAFAKNIHALTDTNI